MNPKKNSRRCRASVSIQALDLAISRFIHSLAMHPPQGTGEGGGLDEPVRRLEPRGALVYKWGRKYQHDCITSLKTINSIKHQYRQHLGFGVFIDIRSMHLPVPTMHPPVPAMHLPVLTMHLPVPEGL
jgi:hypothetical protein